jgi:hypothetical protein
MRKLSPALAVLALSLASAAPAHAQQAAIADELYKQGQKLMEQGKVHEACEKFKASQEADPAIGTLINLALCHEKEGKTASSWDEFNEAALQAQKAGQRDREKYAHEHADALEKQLHKLVIIVADKPDDVVVKLDGKQFKAGVLGTPLPLDPGEHELEVSAPRKKTWMQKVQLGPDAVTQNVSVPKLEDEPETPKPTGPAPGSNRVDGDRPVRTGSTGNTQRIIGFAVGGVGLIAAGVAVYYELTALSRDRDSKDPSVTNPQNLPNCTACQQNATDIHNQAKSAELYAIVSSGVAVAALTTGIVLVVTAPTGVPKDATGMHITPTFSAHGGGGALTWSF